MSIVVWKTYMHKEMEEFPYTLGKALWGKEWEQSFSWENAPDIGEPLYEIEVILQTDSETGKTEILSFRDGDRIFQPI